MQNEILQSVGYEGTFRKYIQIGPTDIFRPFAKGALNDSQMRTPRLMWTALTLV